MIFSTHGMKLSGKEVTEKFKKQKQKQTPKSLTLDVIFLMQHKSHLQSLQH